MRALSSTNVLFCWAGAALLFVALGCGDSSDSSTSTGGSGGSGGSGTTGGSGGTTGGSGGTTGGSGGSGDVPDGGVLCGTTVCPPTPIGPTSAPACCTPQNTCGISFGMTCFDPTTFDAGGPPPEAGTGVPDPNCLSLMTPLGTTLGGCCMTDNTCGFVSPLGGCVSLETLRMLNFPGLNLPEGGPMSCVYPPP